MEIDWCKTCENEYGSIPCINCCDRSTQDKHIIIYYPPSHYIGTYYIEKDKDKKFIKVNTDLE